ncbi:unnamed protein product [Didymodactylos carnosus]|uniref:Uncharacterized protein n=1 Tax=Didymodactylos carnosus TaxID=1234261 RepID=A0A814B2V0_9BILA|nr:unnamed protein product [Didymodactylos carnosus]CAF3699670.1 unnamed protein product [Didymodactylos carnosus]
MGNSNSRSRPSRSRTSSSTLHQKGVSQTRSSSSGASTIRRRSRSLSGRSRGVPLIKEYDVGFYSDLSKHRIILEHQDFILHHLVQRSVGKALIPSYHENNGVCIVLRRKAHEKIQTLEKSDNEDKTARQILADDILKNKQSGVVPNKVLLTAVLLHYSRYPTVFEQLAIVDSRLDIIIHYLEKLVRKDEKTKYLLKYGNNLSSLPQDVQLFLKNHTSGNVASISTNPKSNDTISGTYLIHREYDIKQRQHVQLKIRIEYVRGEKYGNSLATITTRYYNIIYEWS